MIANSINCYTIWVMLYHNQSRLLCMKKVEDTRSNYLRIIPNSLVCLVTAELQPIKTSDKTKTEIAFAPFDLRATLKDS